MLLRHTLTSTVALALGCLVSFWLVSNALADVHSLSRSDDLIGGLWAVLATVFVFRGTPRESVAAGWTRVAATSLSFVLCFAYLVFLPFHIWALPVLVGLGAVVLAVTGRSEDAPVVGITTAVILVAAAVSPHDAWQQPILRLGDTAVGIVVGLLATWAVRFA
jgi:uncharacterized membrane protein YgaE (UPF0421/DUF939 family)